VLTTSYGQLKKLAGDCCFPAVGPSCPELLGSLMLSAHDLPTDGRQGICRRTRPQVDQASRGCSISIDQLLMPAQQTRGHSIILVNGSAGENDVLLPMTPAFSFHQEFNVCYLNEPYAGRSQAFQPPRAPLTGAGGSACCLDLSSSHFQADHLLSFSWVARLAYAGSGRKSAQASKAAP